SGRRRTPRSAARPSARSAATRRSRSWPAGADDRPAGAAVTGVAAVAAATLLRVDERALAERLITYDTSKPDGIRACAGFIKGWLEAREIVVHDSVFGELPVLSADVGPRQGPTVIPLSVALT